MIDNIKYTNVFVCYQLTLLTNANHNVQNVHLH